MQVQPSFPTIDRRMASVGKQSEVQAASAPDVTRPPRKGPRERRQKMSDKPSVVLVHGGFVDGSGWQGVHDLLAADGYRVSVVQNPTLSLEGDAAATRMILDRQDGPTILVGHSYGGQ